MAAASSSSAKDPSPSSSPVPASSAAAAAAASPSPSPSPARSPSPLPLPAATQPAPTAPAPPAPPPPSSSSRRLPPPCWTHEETLALIDSYREKWYALRRGNLRASHWQEVADAVARRCARLPQATPKTSVQCRHKVEKLRKRYRAERQRSLAHDPSLPPSSSWVYFRKMDAMERGPNSSSAPRPSASPSPAPPPSPSPSSSSSDDDDQDEDEDDDDLRGRSGNGNTRSLHRLMANGAASAPSALRFTIPKAVRSKIVGPRLDDRTPASARFFKGYTGGGGIRPGSGPMEEMRRRVEKRRRRERDRERVSGGAAAAAGEMAAALRALGDGFMRVEQMKMEMAREMEKVRMEMELKRTEMVLDAQRRIVDAFVKGFFGRKRAKVSPES